MSAKPKGRAPTAVALLLFGGLQLAAYPAAADSPAPPKPDSQATIKRLGFGISQVTLLPKAASRLDIRLAAISDDASGRKLVPFSAILYDLDGDAWVYKVTDPLSFSREQVVVASVSRDVAILTDGPPVGTQVVIVGVPELYGAEVGVNGE